MLICFPKKNMLIYFFFREDWTAWAGKPTRQARMRPSLEARCSVSCPILSVHLWAIGLRAGRFLFRQAAACAASGMPGSLAGALKRDAASPDQTTVRSRGATPSSDLIYLPLFLFRILDRPVVSQVRTTRTSIERELEWPAASSSRSWPPGCRDRQAASALARLPLLGPPLRPSSPPVPRHVRNSVARPTNWCGSFLQFAQSPVLIMDEISEFFLEDEHSGSSSINNSQ